MELEQGGMSPPASSPNMEVTVLGTTSSSGGSEQGNESIHDDETATTSNAKSIDDRRRKSEKLEFSTTAVAARTPLTRGVLFGDPTSKDHFLFDPQQQREQELLHITNGTDVDIHNVKHNELNSFGNNATTSLRSLGLLRGTEANFTGTIGDNLFPRTSVDSEARLTTERDSDSLQIGYESQQQATTHSTERLRSREAFSHYNAQRTSTSEVLRRDMGYSTTGEATWNTGHPSVKMNANEQLTAERKDQEDDGLSAASTTTAFTLSPAIAPLNDEVPVEMGANGAGVRLPSAAIGTPSTVSTTPSTDDASVDAMDTGALDKLSIKDDSLVQNSQAYLHQRRDAVGRRNQLTSRLNAEASAPRHSHRRVLSWDDPTIAQQQQHGGNRMGGRHGNMHTHSAWSRGQGSQLPSQQIPMSSQGRHAHVDHWPGAVNSPQQARVATFRNDHSIQHGYPPPSVPHSDTWRQQRRIQEPQMMGTNQPGHMHLPPSGYIRRSPYGQHSTMTPPRSRPHRQGQSANRVAPSPSTQPPSAPGQNPPRSSSEILKTLLRKKACLYEPDTSRAVALVTWLVGRELALEYGYFSRQQLQTGVHACVSKKIASGTITRTKVNRCMQIILNSCFHYIIPRPDGSEENGEVFRQWFSTNTQDDSSLLTSLPPPWNDITVDGEVIKNSHVLEGESKPEDKKRVATLSPTASPRLGSIETSGGGESDNNSKRAVLLCFNENVRSAEDVFRCHNEFIRDTANASRLQLTAQEWRTFFGQDASSTPTLWGSPGRRVTEDASKRVDALGFMDDNELAKFRTTWCAKRYDHDHEMCGFAHVEVNNGWLRRNPSTHSYQPEMCPCIVEVAVLGNRNRFIINECAKGNSCEFAHSREEILYHPDFYKTKMCRSNTHGCPYGDVCPYMHSQDAKKFHDGRASTASQRHGGRQHGHFQGTANLSHGRGSSVVPHSGSPMLYVSPAPVSSFESHLVMPGLQRLFRRHSSVVRSHLKSPPQMRFYSYFGDDDDGLSPQSSVGGGKWSDQVQ